MQELWDNCKRRTIPTAGVSEGQTGVEEIVKVIMAKNLSILMAGRRPQAQEPQRTSSRKIPRKTHLGR